MNQRGNNNNYQRRNPRRKTKSSNKNGLIFLTSALILVIIFCSIILFSLESEGTEPTDLPNETTAGNVDDVTGSDSNGADDTTEPQETEPPVIEPPVSEPEFEFEFPEDLNSKYALLIDLSSGEVLASKNASEKTFPASVTKMMTVLVAIENIPDPYSTTTVLSAEMFDYLYRQNASIAGFGPGEAVLAIDLMYASLLPSGGDGSIGLAELVSGSEEEYVKLMNKKAAELGMTSTNFMNATGLHDINHYTSLNDMAKLITYAMKNDVFREIITTRRYSTSPTNVHPDGITFYSTVFSYITATGLKNDYIIGGKTGFTSEAGLCLASLAEIDGKRFALITTGAGDGTNDVKLNAIDAINVFNSLAEVDDLLYA